MYAVHVVMGKFFEDCETSKLAPLINSCLYVTSICKSTQHACIYNEEICMSLTCNDTYNAQYTLALQYSSINLK